MLLNPSLTWFAAHFLRMMRNLCLKSASWVNVHLKDLIALELRKEERTVAMAKDDQSFIQRYMLIKTEKLLLIIIRMADLNQPHMDTLRFMVLM